jgi:hypothetical protein
MPKKERGHPGCALPMSDSILNLLEQSHTIDQLVIVGSSPS